MKKVLSVLAVLAVSAVAVFAADGDKEVTLTTTVGESEGFKVVAYQAGEISYADASRTDLKEATNQKVELEEGPQNAFTVVAYSNKETGTYDVFVSGSAFQRGDSDDATENQRFGYTLTGLQDNGSLVVGKAATKTAQSDQATALTLTRGAKQVAAQSNVQVALNKTDYDKVASGAYTATLVFTTKAK